MVNAERSNYALITALYASRTRGLYSDIYFPIIKYAIVKTYAERCAEGNIYSSSPAIQDKISELFSIKIPNVVIAKTVKRLAAMENSLQLEVYEEGNTFLIVDARFDEDENVYDEKEREFNLRKDEIELEYKEFIEREGSCDYNVTFMEFITANTESILGYFETETEEQVEEKYTSMVFFLDYLHRENPDLYKVANQLFWSSVIVAFLQSERPQVSEYEKGMESEYYLDTSIVMGLLDLSTEENELSARDLCDIIKSAGGRLKVHPLTLDEIKSILASVSLKGAYPGTSIASACMRRDLTTADIKRIELNLQSEIEKKDIVIFPNPSKEIKENAIRKYKGKEILRQLADSRHNTTEYNSADQFREIHDIFMDDYIRDLRIQKKGKENVYFLTSNTDLVNLCKARHEGESYMISMSKVILELWMHNTKPAELSSCALTETMARCLNLHRSKVRTKLYEVAKLFNRHKENVAPEVYSEFLKYLYRRGRAVVELAENIPEDDSKQFMEALQGAIREDSTHYESVNSEMHKRNNELSGQVEKTKEKVGELEVETELKSQKIGGLIMRNEDLTEEKTRLLSDLAQRDSELQSQKQTTDEERAAKEEERKAREEAERRNVIHERREKLEEQLEKLEEEIDPWLKKRGESYRNQQ